MEANIDGKIKIARQQMKDERAMRNDVNMDLYGIKVGWLHEIMSEIHRLNRMECRWKSE